MSGFRSYTDQETALKDLTLLRENNVEANLAQESVHGIHTYHLEIPEVDIKQADSLLSTNKPTISDQPNFMTDYSDDELKEIIINQIDYAQVLVINAKNTLLERHPEFQLSSLQKSQQSVYNAKLKEQTEGIRANNLGLVLAYLSAIAGGLLGLAVGWFIEVSKTTGVDGNKYPTYDIYSRRHGKFIKWIGVIMLTVFTFSLIINN